MKNKSILVLLILVLVLTMTACTNNTLTDYCKIKMNDKHDYLDSVYQDKIMCCDSGFSQNCKVFYNPEWNVTGGANASME